MMTEEEYDALPVGSVLATTSACPSCGKRGVVELTVVFEAEPLGTWSLAGGQMKFPVRKGARYLCTACGASDMSEPKRKG
jgi:hypothetical protein